MLALAEERSGRLGFQQRAGWRPRMKTLGVIPRCFISAKPAVLTGPGERR